MIPVKKVARKTGKGTQYAALCYRVRKGNRLEILLVTGRNSGRWLPPRGWPMKGKRAHEAAAVEAFEEAGVRGDVHNRALGRYRYRRRRGNRTATEAYLFPLRVETRKKSFKEKGERRVKWFSARKAAALVREKALRRMILDFDPAEH